MIDEQHEAEAKARLKFKRITPGPLCGSLSGFSSSPHSGPHSQNQKIRGALLE